MGKKLLIGLGAVAAAVVVFLAFAATRPAEYRVERSTAIAAPAAVVFAYANDLHKWPAWSPWEKMDPAMKKEFSGPETGVGSSYFWSGNDKVGEGRLTISESVPNEKVGMKLEFIKPFETTCAVTLTTKAEGEATRTTWTLEGRNNLVAKAMTVFVSMDSMMGKDFETGLANLKSASEADAKKAAATAPAAISPDAAADAKPVDKTK